MTKLVDFVERCKKGEIDALRTAARADNDGQHLRNELESLPTPEQEDVRRILNEVVTQIKSEQVSLLGARDELLQELKRASKNRDACLLYDRQSVLKSKK